MIRRCFGWMALVVTLACGLVAAGENATVGNTEITAKTLSFDYKRYVALFEGDVVVVDPQLRMEADRLSVIFEGSNQVKSVTASGNVRLRHEDKTATCERAIYLAQAGEVTLMNSAVLSRGDDRVMGEKIVFWMHEDRMSVTPGRLIIGPQSNAGGGGLGKLVKPGGAASSGGAAASRPIRASTPLPASQP